VQLSPDLSMRYRIHLPDDYHSVSHTDTNESSSCEECKISVQLLYNGFSWLGIGVSPKGQMVGGHAVIGQPGLAEPREYYLDGKDIDYITRKDIDYGTSTTVLEDTTIEFIDGQTVMEFTTSFSNWGIQSPVGVSLNNLYTFIWAHGSDGGAALSYHGPNSKSSYTIDNLMGFSSSSSTQQGLNSMASLQQAASTKAAWLAHGIMAFLAFGVFVPLAITTAILRDCDAVPPFCKGLANKISERWLYIHVGLNSFTYIFTLIVFSVAVSTINRERYSHWEHGHSKMGLAIFILASFQVLGGYFRPSSATTLPTTSNGDNNTAKEPAEENDGVSEMTNENSIGEIKAMPMKSTLRQTWELLHHLLGIALFIFGMWQMYEGIELYHARYVRSRSSSLTIAGFYIVWMALWTIVIIGGTLYKWFFQSRDGLGGEDGGVGGEEKQQPGDVVVNDTQELT